MHYHTDCIWCLLVFIHVSNIVVGINSQVWPSYIPQGCCFVLLQLKKEKTTTTTITYLLNQTKWQKWNWISHWACTTLLFLLFECNFRHYFSFSRNRAWKLSCIYYGDTRFMPMCAYIMCAILNMIAQTKSSKS